MSPEISLCFSYIVIIYYPYVLAKSQKFYEEAMLFDVTEAVKHILKIGDCLAFKCLCVKGFGVGRHMQKSDEEKDGQGGGNCVYEENGFDLHEGKEKP
jgi:hypothetical protein